MNLYLIALLSGLDNMFDMMPFLTMAAIDQTCKLFHNKVMMWRSRCIAHIQRQYDHNDEISMLLTILHMPLFPNVSAVFKTFPNARAVVKQVVILCNSSILYRVNRNMILSLHKYKPLRRHNQMIYMYKYIADTTKDTDAIMIIDGLLSESYDVLLYYDPSTLEIETYQHIVDKDIRWDRLYEELGIRTFDYLNNGIPQSPEVQRCVYDILQEVETLDIDMTREDNYGRESSVMSEMFIGFIYDMLCSFQSDQYHICVEQMLHSLIRSQGLEFVQDVATRYIMSAMTDMYNKVRHHSVIRDAVSFIESVLNIDNPMIYP